MLSGAADYRAIYGQYRPDFLSRYRVLYLGQDASGVARGGQIDLPDWPGQFVTTLADPFTEGGVAGFDFGVIPGVDNTSCLRDGGQVNGFQLASIAQRHINPDGGSDRQYNFDIHIGQLKFWVMEEGGRRTNDFNLAGHQRHHTFLQNATDIGGYGDNFPQAEDMQGFDLFKDDVLGGHLPLLFNLM